VSWSWNNDAVMRRLVIVTYAPNLSSFAARTEHSQSDANRAQLIAPSQPSAEERVNPPVPRENPPSSAIERSAPVGFPTAFNALTSRQREVLNLIIQGQSNKEIARALSLAEGTIKIHVAALFGKLGVHRRAALAVLGARCLAAAGSGGVDNLIQYQSEARESIPRKLSVA
jgi:DNA-binding NarL/FixJ family response regulator